MCSWDFFGKVFSFQQIRPDDLHNMGLFVGIVHNIWLRICLIFDADVRALYFKDNFSFCSTFRLPTSFHRLNFVANFYVSFSIFAKTISKQLLCWRFLRTLDSSYSWSWKSLQKKTTRLTCLSFINCFFLFSISLIKIAVSICSNIQGCDF